jgi:L-seryl-tRNA(Ser) seleniumtransferase
VIASASNARVVDCQSAIGGGASPDAQIPSVGLSIAGDVTAALQTFDPPIIARVTDGSTVCDLRTVDPADDSILVRALVEAQGS